MIHSSYFNYSLKYRLLLVIFKDYQRNSVRTIYLIIMKKLRDILLSEYRENIIKIAYKHGAYNVRIFGSVARGEEKENSDIDFLIDYDLNRITPWFPVGLINDLESYLGKKVDVVTEKSLHYFLRDKILKEAVLL